MSSSKATIPAPPPGVAAKKQGSIRMTPLASAEGSSAATRSKKEPPICVAYPVNSILELTLSPHREVVRGLVYCTDEISNSIVLKRSLVHTTLTSEIRVINAASVMEKKVVQAAVSSAAATGSGDKKERDKKQFLDGTLSSLPTSSSKDTASEEESVDEPSLPLTNVSKKAVEERERRAIMLAEERLSHINQKASPEGQAVFDRLLKACNDVTWKGESIVVLSQVRVDPPYGSDDCQLLQTGGLNEGSLERVKMIVRGLVA